MLVGHEPSRLFGKKVFFISSSCQWCQQTLARGRNPQSLLSSHGFSSSACLSQPAPSYKVMTTGFRAQPAPVQASQVI